MEHVSAATALVAFEWVFGATCEPLNLALASRSRRWLRLKWLNVTARYIKRRKGAEMLMGDGNGPRRRRGRDWQVCESRAAVCEARVKRGLFTLSTETTKCEASTVCPAGLSVPPWVSASWETWVLGSRALAAVRH